MDLVVTPLPDDPPGARVLEFVERKGMGHPDTICDALAEEFGLALCRFHLDRFGTILHHNVDKVLLVGGSSAPRFGGGDVLAPIEVYLSGRAHHDYRGVAIPVRELAEAAARAWLRQWVPELDPDRHLQLHVKVRPGSTELTDLFAAGAGAVPRANDTSLGAGFAPATPLERTVLAVEQALQADRRGGRAPHVGADIKVMGVRHGSAFDLTVACAQIGEHVRDLADYRAKVAALADRAAAVARPLANGDVRVAVNAADDLERGRCYLTVTGTSAEAGDDGEAGRGNRVGGLICPCRPMTMESAAGKNPVSHVGKLYNVLAHRVAAAVAAAFPELAAVECLLASRIGAPIDDPPFASVRLRRRDGGDVAALRGPVAQLCREHVAGVGKLWRALLDRAVPVYA